MKKRFTSGVMLMFFLTIIISCNTNPTAKIQGVYEVDKESLKETFKSEMESENSMALGLMNLALENAVIEFCVKGDSINGILFIAGEKIILDYQIIQRNDSLVMNGPDFEAYLIPTETGLAYRASGSGKTINLNKTDRTELSSDTKKAIENQNAAIKEKNEFEQSLGKWQEGNYVDEFGDKTGKGFAYCFIRGTSENSISTQNEVYVKGMVQGENLYFQIYNSSLSMKESFPESKFGRMKLKLPDGSVESLKVFFYDNSFFEDGDDPTLYNFVLKNEGIVKVLVDLSTASDYHSDKYQFAIEKNNLNEILGGLKK